MAQFSLWREILLQNEGSDDHILIFEMDVSSYDKLKLDLYITLVVEKKLILSLLYIDSS